MRTMMRALVASATALVFPQTAFVQPSEPILGTWELNLAKSRFVPGPAPRKDTRTFTLVDGEIRVRTSGIDSAGKPYAEDWTVIYDGQDHPIDNPNADSVMRRRIDPYTIELSLKKAGKVVITGSRVISRDGQTMTITEKGVDARGRVVDTVEVFEKR